MRRRTYLRAAGAAGLAAGSGTAGCLGSALGDRNPNVALGRPDEQRAESAALSYPAYGQRVPDVTLPAPLSGESVSLRDVSRPSLLTFVYTHCGSVCPVLTSRLRQVQMHSLANDYADEVAFYPITFDPARDTAERLRAFAAEMNVDLSADNWRFLRPDGPARAKAVVDEEFGVAFQRTGGAGGGDSGNRTESGTETASGGGANYMFTHLGLVLLVNADGYVERAYRGQNPDQKRLIADLRTVREANG